MPDRAAGVHVRVGGARPVIQLDSRIRTERVRSPCWVWIDGCGQSCPEPLAIRAEEWEREIEPEGAIIEMKPGGCLASIPPPEQDNSPAAEPGERDEAVPTQPAYHGRYFFPRIESLATLAILNLTTRFAGIFMASPV